MSSESLIFKSKPVLYEGALALFLGIMIVSGFTIFDIRFHDFYVLPAVSTCDPNNTEPFCVNIRAKHNLPSNAQVAIGDIYWDMLAFVALFIGVVLFTFRIILGRIMQQFHIQKIFLSTVMMAFFYALVGSGLFLFGVLDTLYFVFQGQPIPEELPWLSGAGIFDSTKAFFGNPDIVETEDLLATNFIGITLIITFWFITMVVFAENRRKKQKIA